MFPGKSHGRFSVTNEGTLVISSVRKEDRGYYTCSALSVVGSSMAKGHLEVTANADLPPPVIRLGPANQTLPINTAAIMPCEASGKPTPTVRWQYNGVPLQIATKPRYVILQSGTLRINGKLHMITWLVSEDEAENQPSTQPIYVRPKLSTSGSHFSNETCF